MEKGKILSEEEGTFSNKLGCRLFANDGERMLTR